MSQAAPAPAPGGRRGTWIIAGALAFVLAGGGVAAAIVVAGGNDDEGTEPGASQPVTSGVDQPTETLATESGPTSTPEPPPESRTYQRDAYELTLPIDWEPDERSDDKGTYIESSWHPEGDPDVTILVDHTPGFSGTPEDGALAVQELFEDVDDYTEISFGPTQIAGLDAWEWEFELKGDQKVDWFVSECATGYAVLGQAPVGEFEDYRSTFTEVAESLRPSCG